MNIKDGFVLREVAGQAVVIATGEASKTFHGMAKLNETGAEIWRAIAEGASEEEAAARLVAKYDVDAERAAADVATFVGKMAEAGFLA